MMTHMPNTLWQKNDKPRRLWRFDTAAAGRMVRREAILIDLSERAQTIRARLDLKLPARSLAESPEFDRAGNAAVDHSQDCTALRISRNFAAPGVVVGPPLLDAVQIQRKDLPVESLDAQLWKLPAGSGVQKLQVDRYTALTQDGTIHA